MIRLGYVTSGFRDHRLEDVFEILAELGYQGVGITLDVGHLDPRTAQRAGVEKMRDLLQRHGLEAVVETGARYALDPRRKHWPTLISACGRERRRASLERAVEIAAGLGARVLSLWSGALEPDVSREEAWRWLLDGLEAVGRRAASAGVVLGFEPEPGMFVATLDDWRELLDRAGEAAPAMTLDLGHLQCTEEPPHDRWIREFAGRIVNVHVDDIRDRVHEHLPIGEGEIDFPPLFAALREIDYGGLALVELARHSHAAPRCAAASIRAIRELAPEG